MSRKTIIILIFISFFHSFSQCNEKNNHINENRNYWVEALVESFDEDSCNYYQIDIKDSYQAIKLYTKEFTFKKITLKKIISKEILKLLKESYHKLKPYIWISNKESRIKSMVFLGFKFNISVIKLDTTNQAVKDYLNDQKNTEKKSTVNYFDNYSEFINTKSNNNRIKDILLTLKEISVTGTNLVSSNLMGIGDVDFQNIAIKSFVAFELYYTILVNQQLDE